MAHEQPREPEPTATDEHRRKLLILSVLGALVIFLIWLATFPLNYRDSDNATDAPAQFIEVLSEDIETSSEAIKNAQPDNN